MNNFFNIFLILVWGRPDKKIRDRTCVGNCSYSISRGEVWLRFMTLGVGKSSEIEFYWFTLRHVGLKEIDYGGRGENEAVSNIVIFIVSWAK